MQRTNGHERHTGLNAPPAPALADDELDLLETADIDRLFKMKPGWAYRASRRRKNPLPAIRLGRYVRFREREVRMWLESQKTASAFRRG